MADPTPAEIKAEIYEVVKQFFHRHKNEFKVYGDALGWLYSADHEMIRQEAGMLGRSLFTTDILYLVSSYGPQAEIDFAPLMPTVEKKVPDYMPPEPEPEVKSEIKKPKKKRGRPPGRKAKKSGPTNALGDVVIIKDESTDDPVVDVEEPVVETTEEAEPQGTPPKRPRRRAGRVPPGAFAELE